MSNYLAQGKKQSVSLQSIELPNEEILSDILYPRAAWILDAASGPGAVSGGGASGGSSSGSRTNELTKFLFYTGMLQFFLECQYRSI